MTEGERSLRRSRRSFLALTGGERSLRVLYTLKSVKGPRDDLGISLRVSKRRSVTCPVLIYEGHHYFGRRSSSAWAKKAAALRNISFAHLSSHTSRSSCFILARSSLLRRMILLGLKNQANRPFPNLFLKIFFLCLSVYPPTLFTLQQTRGDSRWKGNP